MYGHCSQLGTFLLPLYAFCCHSRLSFLQLKEKFLKKAKPNQATPLQWVLTKLCNAPPGNRCLPRNTFWCLQVTRVFLVSRISRYWQSIVTYAYTTYFALLLYVYLEHWQKIYTKRSSSNARIWAVPNSHWSHHSSQYNQTIPRQLRTPRFNVSMQLSREQV